MNTLNAFITMNAVIVLAVILAIGPAWLAFLMFVGIIALGRWLTLPPRCPQCDERMVANYDKQQDECRACDYGRYWN